MAKRPPTQKSVLPRPASHPRSGAQPPAIGRGLGDEAGDEVRGRVAEHFLRGAGLLQAALVDDDDPVGEGEGLPLVVGDEHRGDAQLLVHALEPGPQLLAHLGVDGPEGLVEREILGGWHLILILIRQIRARAAVREAGRPTARKGQHQTRLRAALRQVE